ncbi:MAG: hypothetical protein OQL27_10985 [Sedimenticola sp.]|nr:hypothetical protein [Sedimenticola sp.]
MTKRPIQLLLLILLLPLTTLAVFADNSPSDQQGNLNETEVIDEESTWDKTKKIASSVAQSSKEVGSATADKTSEFYQSAKETGRQAGEVIAEKSRYAWHKTKQIGSDIADKSREWSNTLTE